MREIIACHSGALLVATALYCLIVFRSLSKIVCYSFLLDGLCRNVPTSSQFVLILAVLSTELVFNVNVPILHVAVLSVGIATSCTARACYPLSIGIAIRTSNLRVATVSYQRRDLTGVQFAAEAIVVDHELFQIWQG